MNADERFLLRERLIAEALAAAFPEHTGTYGRPPEDLLRHWSRRMEETLEGLYREGIRTTSQVTSDDNWPPEPGPVPPPPPSNPAWDWSQWVPEGSWVGVEYQRIPYEPSQRRVWPSQVLTIDPRRDKALEVLGLTGYALPDEIKRQYRRLARERHPDVGGSEEAMRELNAAYGYLAS